MISRKLGRYLLGFTRRYRLRLTGYGSKKAIASLPLSA